LEETKTLSGANTKRKVEIALEEFVKRVKDLK
jgi:hypothetical protein